MNILDSIKAVFAAIPSWLTFDNIKAASNVTKNNTKRFCSICNGTGRVKKFGSNTDTEVCIRCEGTGFVKI
jgi:DnaJ-class molecular chaperone